MRLSKGYWQTYKEVPKDAEVPSHQLMMRAGLIHKSGAGLYNYLPLGLRSIRKVENIIRQELDKIGCFELTMSVVTPGELWQETGRWEAMGDLMLKFKDKSGRDLCISPTNEEAIVDIFRKTVKSYKELPVTLYQINTKFRDEIRPRFGLMRGREFIMKDAYSFHTTKECLDEVYNQIYGAYSKIFERIGLEFIVVEADGGAMTGGGKAKTHEFQVVANAGEDVVVFCPGCKYAANIEAAETVRAKATKLALSSAAAVVDTPNKKTIEEVCSFLGISQDHGLKTLVYESISGDESNAVLVVVVGDDSVNEVKLKAALRSDHLRAASDSYIESLGLMKGYIGPGLTQTNKEVLLLVDSQIDIYAPYLVGANQENKHIKDFVLSRDLKLKYTQADLRQSKENDLCGKCGKPVLLKRGIEVGHIFQLGTKYTTSMNTTVLNKEGEKINPIMGCYGIGVTRVVAATIEQHHDEKGIVWPISIAPFQVYFGVLAKNESIKQLANEIYEELLSHGVQVLFDDRDVGAGFMFKDADLLGLPIRLVLGERDYAKDQSLEIKIRKTGETMKVTKAEVASTLVSLIKKLENGRA